jgi:surfactin synthase thioesterase subunit
MKLLKNNLLLYKPELLIYCSSRNEENTESDIGEMGKRLADEILDYIRDFCPGSALGRVSFIGYSLGGLIARASLSHLETLHSKLHTFITLSSPHISFLYSSSSLIDAGMWILKKLKNSESLLQLTMSDNADLKETFVYKLSQAQELSLFKNIVFFGSDQDTYCPFDSATIQISDDISRDRG